MNRNNLARASNTPGRTQELNFFDVGEPALFRIVDMPGYGYAKAPIKTVQQWRYLINDYLRGRAVLKRVFVLIDSRHGISQFYIVHFQFLSNCVSCMFIWLRSR